MSSELFEKIVEDLREIPKNLDFLFSLSHVNEPFLDNRVFQFTELVLDRLPGARPAFVSNGHPVTEDVIRKLGALPRFYGLQISLNDHRPDHYRQTMQLDQARVLARLDRLDEMIRSGTVSFPVTLTRVGDGTAVDDEFVAWVRARYPWFTPYVHERGDWVGGVAAVTAPVPDIGCQFWYSLIVHADGVVAYCCMDGEQKYAIGDANTENVLRIYNQERLRKQRVAAPSRLTVSPCNRCTMR